jgi:hypothetical protein
MLKNRLITQCGWKIMIGTHTASIAQVRLGAPGDKKGFCISLSFSKNPEPPCNCQLSFKKLFLENKKKEKRV